MKLKIILTLLLVLFLIGCSGEPDTIPTDNTTIEPAGTDNTTTNDTTPTDTTTDNTTTTTGTVHTVIVQKAKFDPSKFTIAVGDTVVWKNEREEGRFGDAFIIGSSGSCHGLRGDRFSPGEEYSYTFEEKGLCTYVDGMVTTAVGKITIE